MIVYILNFFSWILFIPVINHWINEYLYLKVILQIAGVTVAGILLGYKWHRKFSLSQWINFGKELFLMINTNGITSVIILAGSLFFWVIPRSIDLAVSNEIINYTMLVNLYLAGVLFGYSLPLMPFIVKTALAIYGLAMLLTMGTINLSINTLLCAVYDLEMQKETGKYLLIIFPVLFFLFLYYAAKNLMSADVNVPD